MGTKWVGVFPLDKIPINRRGGMIINTQESNLPGEHWIAIYVDDSIFVMDPLGFYYPQPLVNLVSETRKKVFYNKIQYQDPLTDFCGHICLIWLASL